VVSLVLSPVFKTVFGIFLAPLVWKLAIPFPRNTLIPVLLEFINIILEEKLSNKYKNGLVKFSGVRVLGLLAWISQNHEVQRFTGKLYVG
jgi:hypothetical protein